MKNGAVLDGTSETRCSLGFGMHLARQQAQVYSPWALLRSERVPGLLGKGSTSQLSQPSVQLFLFLVIKDLGFPCPIPLVLSQEKMAFM